MPNLAATSSQRDAQSGPAPESAEMRPPPLDYRPPFEPWLAVLHIDPEILVLSKPSGLLSVPGKTPDLADCLEARAQARHPGARTVHRLDLETSGVVVMARSLAALRHLNAQFAERRARKIYVARVAGRIAADEGRIDLPLRADWPRRPMQRVDFDAGKPAVTLWRALGRDADATWVELRPTTGRSHQLRVHMMSMGHPILGDPFYAPEGLRAGRMQLHARALEFRHPADGRWIRFDDPPPFQPCAPRPARDQSSR